jgi:membrane-bound metal-dependent hydrolase YbcI (DUF457 family)
VAERAKEHERAAGWTAAALGLLLAFGILTQWAPRMWPVAALQVGIWALAAVWLAGAGFRGWPLRGHPLLIPLGGATLWSGLQLAAAQTISRWETETAALDWFARLAIFFVALQAFGEERRRRRWLDAALWCGFALAVAAVLQKYTSPDRILWLFPTDKEGVMGPFPYHNQYAAFVETLFPLALLRVFQSPRESWRPAVIAGTLAASVVAATSRAGSALIALEFLAVLLLVGRRRPLPGKTLAAAAAWVGALCAVFALSVGWEPLRVKFDRSDQFGERRALTESSIRMALDRPGMGFGLGTWALAYPAYATFDDGAYDNQAHNDWAQWAAEGGLPFLALMLAATVLLERPAVRSVWGVGLLAVLLHCLVDYPFQQRPVFGYYWFAMAALVCSPPAKDDAGGPGEDV